MHNLLAVVLTFAFVAGLGALALVLVGWWERRLPRGLRFGVARVHSRRPPRAH